MVSMLSSRLMQNAPTSSIVSLMNPTANPTAKLNTNHKRISGYSADREGAKLISFEVEMCDEKQKRANEVEALSKKRKLAEIYYDAANARSDIAKAGLACPPGLVGRSRALPPGSVCMDSVTLILSKDYDKISANHHIQAYSFSPYRARLYYELLFSCRHHYESSTKRVKVPPQQTTQNTEGSMDTPSTYSLSDTDSDDINDVNIPARSDGSFTGEDGCDIKRFDDDDSILQAISTCQLSISFEQAVSYNPLARLIVQAESPFKIIFSNAAYTRLTGIESHLIVGHPLCENGLSDMNPETIYDTCLSCENHEVWAFTSTSKTEENQREASRPKIKCHMTIRAINKDGSSISLRNKMEQPGVRTHFCLDIDTYQGKLKMAEKPKITDAKSNKEICTMKMMG